MLDTRNRDYRRELERETDREGISTAAWAGIAFVVMVIGGIAMYALSNSGNITALQTRPGIESSVPPATTGQGGAQSKMPTVNEKSQ
jgi:hypothetical protein